MFNKGIYGIELASEVADRLFSNITVYGGLDWSFVATLRALLHKRLPQDETVHLAHNTVFQSVTELGGESVSHCMTWFLLNVTLHPSDSAHHIHIVHTTDTDAGEKMLDIIKANAGVGKRFMTEYTRRDDLHVFYARKAKALFYTHESGRNTIIFTDKLDLKHFHALQMMIPKYLPGLFADNPLTEAEANLLKSLGNKSAVEYEALIADFANAFNFRDEIIRSKLEGFDTVFERIQADSLREKIKIHQQDYDSQLSTLRSISNKINDSMYTLAGLEGFINNKSGDSELMEYFICNKNLVLIRVSGTIIEFVAHGYADVYDIDAFEKYVSNHSGYMYSGIASLITKPEMERLYRSIFEDGLYKLRMCAAYTVDLRSGVHGLQHFAFPTESDTYFPNTHIQHFGCIGSYATRFEEYIRNRDYVGAIDQAIVSARNLNFYDSSVIGRFGREFSRTDIKCIEAHDGRLLTPIEAISELEGAETWQDQ